jgi:hypothetical protein
VTVEPIPRGEETIGIWSPGILDDTEVVLELQPFRDDDPRVIAGEAQLRQQVLGEDS